MDVNWRHVLNFRVCFVPCVALILQPWGIYREWGREADSKWSQSPSEISGKALLDFTGVRICPRDFCLSGLPLASQTLTDNSNGKILWALSSFSLRPSWNQEVARACLGRYSLHLAEVFYHPKSVKKISCQLLCAIHSTALANLVNCSEKQLW